MKYSASGSPVLRFSVAANYRSRNQSGEWEDKTEWVRVTVMGQRAETLSKHLSKGSRVYVDGRLEARPWTNNQGQVMAGLEIVANEVQFMSPRQEQPEGEWKPIQQKPAAVAADDGDLVDLPF